MTKYVVDTSVVVKWFVEGGEEFIDAARDIQSALIAREIGLFAPRVLPYEVASVLLRCWRDGKLGRTREQLLRAYSAFLELPIEYVDDTYSPSDTSPLYSAIDCAADAQGKNFNDHRFIMLALALGVSWITDDRRARTVVTDALQRAILPLSRWHVENP